MVWRITFHRLSAKLEAEKPEGTPLQNARIGAIGEAGEYTLEPTNWRGITTNRTPRAETQQMRPAEACPWTRDQR